MKKDKMIFLCVMFCLCLFCESALGFDQNTCNLCREMLGEDLGGGYSVFANRTLLTGAAGSSGTECSDAVLAARNTEMARSIYTGGSCDGSTVCCQTDDCAMFMVVVKCLTSWIASQTVREDAKIGSGTVAEVPLGQEKDAAETFFDNFDGTTDYEDYTSQGLIRTDGLKGYIYTATLGESDQESTVIVGAWKRGGYAPSGSTTTLEDLGSGGSGGDTAESVEEGVGNAIDDKFGTYTGTPAELDDSETRDKTESSYDAVSGEYETLPEQDSITDTITGFLSSNPIVSVFTGSSLSATAGVCEFTAEVLGQNITVGLCDVEEHIINMGSIVLIVGTLYSMFIALGRA